MAGSPDADEPSSSPRWALRKAGSFFGTTGLLAVVVFAFASPAVLLVPTVVPASEPFVWFALIGLSITFSSPSLTEEESSVLQELLEDVNDLPQSAQLVYLASFLFMMVSGLSTLVAAIGVAGAAATATPLAAVAAIPFALGYPTVEVWLSRTLGWNVTSTGAAVALVPLLLVTRLTRSPNVSQNAFRRIRGAPGS